MFSCALLEVRLSGGRHNREGRVELRYLGSWGTICDDSWDITDAHVVCRMLDFKGAIEARGSAYFGPGSGDILLDNVRCNGSESNIADCQHNGLRNHDCGHNEDAGVTCTSPGMRVPTCVRDRFI